MGSVALPVLLALLAAAVVLVLSAIAAGRGSGATTDLLADLQAGLSGSGRPERAARVGVGAPAAPCPDDADGAAGAAGDGSVDDLFVLGRPTTAGYVTADHLAGVLERAQGALRGGVQHIVRR